MKHLAAYLLIGLAGKTPTKDDITSVLESVGIDADEERLDKLISELDGKDINEVGTEKHIKRRGEILTNPETVDCPRF